MQKIISKVKSRITPQQVFMISVLLVNGGNYLYNLLLGRYLGPEKFADAAILVTFLLVLSFMAMTFQLVTAKFSVLFNGDTFDRFINYIYKISVIFSLLLAVLIIIYSAQLQQFFNTSTKTMFTVFGIGVPFYFIMSVNRGIFQGKEQLFSLSITYQTEMLSRFFITFALLFLLDISSSIVIAIGIFFSFIFGIFPIKIPKLSLSNDFTIDTHNKKLIKNFFIITAFYELTQIIINNSDILLVKHYFDSYNAGLYASLALIGRIVYFMAWMFVMLLLPTVIKLKKEGKSTLPILTKYVFYIALISTTIIVFCVFFPEQIILVLFGDSYIAMAPLLWKYATATGVFAISNIFAYYYLSLDKYIPVIVSGLFGLLQVLLIVFYHSSLEQVVVVQIIIMVLLLVIQLLLFLIFNKDELLYLNKKTV